MAQEGQDRDGDEDIRADPPIPARRGRWFGASPPADLPGWVIPATAIHPRRWGTVIGFRVGALARHPGPCRGKAVTAGKVSCRCCRVGQSCGGCGRVIEPVKIFV